MDLGGGQNYRQFSDKYGAFASPASQVKINGKLFVNNKNDFFISKLTVENTSGFEASVAELFINGAYDSTAGVFLGEELSKTVEIGSIIEISLGYFTTLVPVFKGVAVGVSYRFEHEALPVAVVTAMDVKGVMMANCYAMQLSAKSYGDAVREILRKPTYAKLYDSLEVTNTPDAQDSDQYPELTMEMSAESDYEFIVKAAMKFNFEFFVEGGVVYFRKAKIVKPVQATLSAGAGISTFDISYSVTGLVDKVEVRALDAGTGKTIAASIKRSGSLSLGSKAKALLSKSLKVYLDPTVYSKSMAEARAASLMETMSYRFGEFTCECVGIPDLVPGRFLRIDGLGSGVNNTFYITRVTHKLSSDGYTMELSGCAAELESMSSSAALGGGGFL